LLHLLPSVSGPRLRLVPTSGGLRLRLCPGIRGLSLPLCLLLGGLDQLRLGLADGDTLGVDRQVLDVERSAGDDTAPPSPEPA